MKEFAPKLEILSPAQRQIWHELSSTPNLGFTLYGGTALALRLRHRTSSDFAFFSDAPLDKQKLRAHIPPLQEATVIQDTPDTLTVLATSMKPPVKISFFGGLSFGRVSDPELTTDGAIEVASFNDLFGTKLKALLDRVEAKDYRDIIALLQAGHRLSDGLAVGRALFGKSFQPSEALKALTSFEGGDLGSLTSDERKFLEMSVLKVHEIPQLHISSHRLSEPPRANE